MSNPSPIIVVTSGEPAGIGPDLCAMLAARDLPARVLILCDPAVMAERIRALDLEVRLLVLDDASRTQPHKPGSLQLLPLEAGQPVRAGQLDPRNAAYVLRQLETGLNLCTGPGRAALVTAPVQKSTINEAGIAFTGHTEWLAEHTGSARPVMTLVSPRLRVALATTHLPLSRVPSAITRESLEEVVTVLDHGLRTVFAVESPRIMVLGLNPHAGESGTLGREEQEVMLPALRAVSERGIVVTGPIPADTAFTGERLAQSDAVLAMYHDQGLPVIKALCFGEVVNLTLGLPIIRTSVDHGTAVELAGTGAARVGSLEHAVGLAIELASREP